MAPSPMAAVLLVAAVCLVVLAGSAQAACAGGADVDADGICDAVDNCPGNAYNPTQTDSDGDGVGDVCDNCPDVPNADQAPSVLSRLGAACVVLVRRICRSGVLLTNLNAAHAVPVRYSLVGGGVLADALTLAAGASAALFPNTAPVIEARLPQLPGDGNDAGTGLLLMLQVYVGDVAVAVEQLDVVSGAISQRLLLVNGSVVQGVDSEAPKNAATAATTDDSDGGNVLLTRCLQVPAICPDSFVLENSLRDASLPLVVTALDGDNASLADTALSLPPLTMLQIASAGNASRYAVRLQGRVQVIFSQANDSCSSESYETPSTPLGESARFTAPSASPPPSVVVLEADTRQLAATRDPSDDGDGPFSSAVAVQCGCSMGCAAAINPSPPPRAAWNVTAEAYILVDASRLCSDAQLSFSWSDGVAAAAATTTARRLVLYPSAVAATVDRLWPPPDAAWVVGAGLYGRGAIANWTIAAATNNTASPLLQRCWTAVLFAGGTSLAAANVLVTSSSLYCASSYCPCDDLLAAGAVPSPSNSTVVDTETRRLLTLTIPLTSGNNSNNSSSSNDTSGPILPVASVQLQLALSVAVGRNTSATSVALAPSKIGFQTTGSRFDADAVEEVAAFVLQVADLTAGVLLPEPLGDDVAAIVVPLQRPYPQGGRRERYRLWLQSDDGSRWIPSADADVDAGSVDQDSSYTEDEGDDGAASGDAGGDSYDLAGQGSEVLAQLDPRPAAGDRTLRFVLRRLSGRYVLTIPARDDSADREARRLRRTTLIVLLVLWVVAVVGFATMVLIGVCLVRLLGLARLTSTMASGVAFSVAEAKSSRDRRRRLSMEARSSLDSRDSSDVPLAPNATGSTTESSRPSADYEMVDMSSGRPSISAIGDAAAAPPPV